MLTVSYLELLKDCADRCGLLTPEGDVPSVHAAFLTRMIQKRVRRGWRYFDWPDLCPVEARAFRPVHSLGTGYLLDDEVYDTVTDAYFVAIQDVPSGTPLADEAYWDSLTTFARYVARRQIGAAAIGEVLSATTRDPRTNQVAGSLAFTLNNQGVLFLPDAPTTVWLKFRLPAPAFTTESWTAGTYASGAVVYHAGECWLSLANDNTNTPGVEPDVVKWELQQVPEFLRHYATEAVYADWLQDDGQASKSSVREEEAEELLAEERNQFTRTQGQPQRYAVRVR